MFTSLALDGMSDEQLEEIKSDVENPTTDGRNQTRLHRAAYAADLPLVKLLLQLGADVHPRTRNGSQPLHLACGYRGYPDAPAFQVSSARVEIMRLLLAAGAVIDSKNNLGDTALSLAYRTYVPYTVAFLISAGANRDVIANPTHRPPVFLVRLVRENDGARTVATMPKDRIKAVFRDGLHKHPLCCAAWVGSPSAVIALVNAGAVIAQDGYGMCPLHFAAELMRHHGDSNKVATLLETEDKDTASSCSATLVDVEVGPSASDAAANEGNVGPGEESTSASFPSGADAVQVLLERSPYINHQSNAGVTALYRAVEAGSMEAIHWLLEHGADPNISKDHIAPIHHAHSLIGYAGGLEALRALVKAGAKVDKADIHNQTALNFAAEAGSAAAILFLLKAGANPRNLDREGRSALHFPAKIFSQPQGPEAMQALVDAGVSVNLKDSHGDVPLSRAGRAGAGRAVLWLLEAGTRPNLIPCEVLNKLVRSPRSGAQAVTALLRAGWHNKPLRPGGSLVHRAALLGFAEVIFLLVRGGEDPNAVAADDNADRPLHWAVEAPPPRAEGDLHVIEALVNIGADVDAVGAANATPLHRAALLGSASAAHALLSLGADPNARDEQGRTPLHYAVESLRPDAPLVITTLLAGGSDINAVGADGHTPIRRALVLCSISVVKTLMDKQADVRRPSS
ncbi:hypothetical protein BOTBODRAFT_257835 [Botryobasidium botryosum FD-172 SS1]|uniref:Uncharacterized protein n=1 Tax=Botryobasidium botryosum (strain FD-172 SS1) TaxID=930990 RepID=A0A067MWH7_BOTB1|nr:hypothetical protein BOTBODRAFT_257835 [Botryobasidium botryosum FD-172 SS1]